MANAPPSAVGPVNKVNNEIRGVSESCEMKSKISTLLATIKYCCSTSGSNGVNNYMPLLLNLKISQMHSISTCLNATLLSKVKHPLIVTLLDCFLVFSHTDTSDDMIVINVIIIPVLIKFL